ncbi:hypothetical protein [Legionella sp.]|uniref:hypothetical protein n=1 Tax=Legionella sp. TaxID=459 RepID=UPI00321F764E
MKKTSLRRWAVTIFLMIMAVVVQAAEVKFNIVPVLRAPNTMPANGLAYAQYMITNNTGIARELTTVPIPGVRHFVTGAPGTCHSPFVLAHGQSCLLVLELLAHEMAGGVHSGPVVCKTMGPGDNRPDASLCSQPYPTDFLQINLTPAIPVGLVANTSAVVFSLGSTGSVTITNTNPFGFAQHLDIHFILNTAISITSSTCPSHLPPNASCVITFSATSGATTTLSVMGTNTNQLLIPITAAANVPISVSPNPLVLGVGNSSSITVTNLSATVPAINVRATPPAASTNIQVSSTNCPTSLPPGGSCTITFSATGVQSGITVPIQGTNTNQVNLSVSSQVVRISSNPNLTLGINQLGTVTVTNQSSTGTAYNIQPTIPSGSGITATTSPACSVLAPGGTCTMQFSGSLLQSSGVNIFIQGSNTNQTAVKITILQATLQVTPNPLALSEGGPASSITVMNTSSVAVTSNILPATGTTSPQNVQVTANTCIFSQAAPFQPSSSCTISFQAPIGSTASQFIVQSATPNATNQTTLNVTVSEVVINISPTLLTLTPGGQGQVTITNQSSTAAALNLAATPTTLCNNNTCDSTCGTSLAPSGTCTMTFNGNTNPPQTNFVDISGDNTNTVRLQINTVGTILTLQPTLGSPYITVSPNATTTTLFSVTYNNSSGPPLSNITLILPSSWTQVIQDDSACAGPIFPGETCTISLGSDTAYIAQNTIHAQDGAGDTSNNTAIGFIQDGGFVFDITNGVVTVADQSDAVQTLQWQTTNVLTNANSTTDGLTNTQAIMQNSGLFGAPAAGDCWLKRHPGDRHLRRPQCSSRLRPPGPDPPY